MSNYRRFRSEGAIYFFTVALADRGRSTLTDNIDMLRHVYALTARERPFVTDAIVVLPDHVHCIWTLPKADGDFSTRWGAIKSRFTRAIKCRVGFHPTNRSQSKIAKGDAGIWQRRFWEHCIRDEADYREHMRYCWSNPVKHGLVEKPEDWPYSSIHRDIESGIYNPL